MARPAAEILDERARGRAADLLIGREEKADRASDRGAEARGIAKRHQGQIDAALHVIDPGPVEAVAVAAHRERVRKRAHRVDGFDNGDDEAAGTIGRGSWGERGWQYV